MLTVAEARSIIAAALPALPAEEVSLAHACRRILRQDVRAERDQPPFDRVMMDGIAVDHAAFAKGRREFQVAGTQHAGDAVTRLPNVTQCIEVMTGAVLPQNTDCVIPVERTSRKGDAITVEYEYEAASRQYIHPRASDHSAGTVVLSAGRRISAIDVALLASAGLATLQVTRQPAVRIISTGNELVPAGKPIEQHQVRLSNGPALTAMLTTVGFTDCQQLHLPDDPQALKQAIGAELAASDVLVLSGGVSMGKADYVPQVLAALGVKQLFHRVSQRPGKPLWFGSGTEGQAVFALPGNPVSALTCCRHYVLPALLAASGMPALPAMNAILADDYRFAPALTCFLPVRLLPEPDGRLHA
ncbi:MAG: molybdopterin molybdotransferase MoeA, partial [Woeseia sp.]|nr:molybdopterin molybdotransferase MoeA [Woeseia sp.]NNL55230.1 molybdopterin molybdotransferase MoeA [Woeseia sp.]